ncbi:MAG: phospholipase D family protein [Pseudoxanthomonas suwonensis]|nr:phospholipase D family protein [Pseudoxanthomonas suwonensis]
MHRRRSRPLPCGTAGRPVAAELRPAKPSRWPGTPRLDIGGPFPSSSLPLDKFLNTSATNYFLEELIKNAKDRLILISPYLKLNDRIKELVADKNRLKIDVRIVYGKSDLQPAEIAWLNDLTYVRTSFCRNLHAKCYLNEELCIVTSLKLYEFSQVNNNEMGVLFERSEDTELYREAYEEAQRIIRINEEVRISLKAVPQEAVVPSEPVAPTDDDDGEDEGKKLTGSRLAQKLKMKNVAALNDRLVELGLLELREAGHFLTDKGRSAGGEFRTSKRFGPYLLWPEEMDLS